MFETKYPTARLEVLEIQNEVGGQRDSIYKALDRLCKRGLLVKRPSPTNRRFKVYGLPLIQLDATDEHSPPTMPVIYANPISETPTQTETQTLDITLDTHWT